MPVAGSVFDTRFQPGSSPGGCRLGFRVCVSCSAHRSWRNNCGVPGAAVMPPYMKREEPHERKRWPQRVAILRGTGGEIGSFFHAPLDASVSNAKRLLGASSSIARSVPPEENTKG